MAYLAVAYYTEKTGYEEEIKNLSASLDRFGIPKDIVGIPTQGSWQANTHYKAYFLKQMLIRHYPQDILYLDADARVQQYPALFDQVHFDMGVFFWKGEELISSTLYLANNPKVFEVIDRWITCCFDNPNIWDQKILQYVLSQSEDLDLKIHQLPAGYCQIFDLMADEGDPVIEQFQASRRFKGEVDKPLPCE